MAEDVADDAPAAADPGSGSAKPQVPVHVSVSLDDEVVTAEDVEDFDFGS